MSKVDDKTKTRRNQDRKIDPDALAPLVAVGLTPIPLHRWNDKQTISKAGKTIIRELGKRPRDSNWTVRAYDPETVIADCLKHGWNVGVRLTDSWCVVDIDPRNGGTDGFANVCEDFRLDPSGWPCVLTGSGGLHYYLRKPEGVKISDTLAHEGDPKKGPGRYAGVEFKSLGRQMVAPGSWHPCGVRYEWEGFDSPPDLSDAPDVPSGLLEAITRPVRAAAAGGGHISPERLALALEGLDPADFADHDKWLQAMMAAHHATGGDGREEFIEWSTSDPEYADMGEEIGRRWDSLHTERPKGENIVTVASLNRFLVDAERKDLLLPTESAADAFDDGLQFKDEAPAKESDSEPEDYFFEFEGFPDPISSHDLFDGEFDPPTYIVPDMVLDKDATAYYANGGLGKTTKAEQLAAAIAAGVGTWLGEEVNAEASPVLIMSGESDADEVKHRIRNIVNGTKALRGVDAESLLRKNLIAYPLFSATPCLIEVTSGKRTKPTHAFRWLEARIRYHKPRLVILDSLYNFYSEDESDKPLVHQFAMLLRRLAKKHKCAIIVIGHPSLSGMESGRGTSGATTWFNAFRGWIFETAEEPKKGDKRIHKLEAKKAQYGSPGKIVECYWKDGCYKALTEDEREDRAEAVKEKFLELLASSIEYGNPLTVTEGTSRSAYIVFAKDGDNNDGYTKAEFKSAMVALLKEGRIGMREYTKSNRDKSARLEPITDTEFG